jgi:prepilin-type N-terminal cleavage/methylation domain-containing protein
MRSRRGFTLLEAAMAMAIIGVITVTLFGALAADLRAAAKAKEILPAAALARERLAVLEVLNPRTLRMLPDSLSRGAFAAPYESYRWKESVTEVSTAPGLVDISIVIEWAQGSLVLRQRLFRPVPTIPNLRLGGS